MIGQVLGDFYGAAPNHVHTRREIKQLMKILIEELHRFYEINISREGYMQRQDEYLHQIIKSSYLRNERNMERIDKVIGQQNALIGQQNEIFKMIDRQNQKTQERADRVLAIFESKI